MSSTSPSGCTTTPTARASSTTHCGPCTSTTSSITPSPAELTPVPFGADAWSGRGRDPARRRAAVAVLARRNGVLTCGIRERTGHHSERGRCRSQAPGTAVASRPVAVSRAPRPTCGTPGDARAGQRRTPGPRVGQTRPQRTCGGDRRRSGPRAATNVRRAPLGGTLVTAFVADLADDGTAIPGCDGPSDRTQVAPAPTASIGSPSSSTLLSIAEMSRPRVRACRAR